jgi:acetyl-CoA carboxylase carboxyltransferase component
VADVAVRLAGAEGAEKATLTNELAGIRSAVRAEKLGEVASEFDRVHSIQRAVAVGSVDAVIQPEELRPQLIAALEAGQ